ncbi:MAG: RsmB/NOP family class I SAM-dependent RNA methyltransferase [Stomatobaculum sp.]|nr:RsmB/NOP family class I SAM-dependent RNA methyltransferase [Stomatobaculum sp.]
MKLPEEFLLGMEQLLGEEYEVFLNSLAERPLSGLRVNTMKTEPEYISRTFGDLRRVPWTENGFYLPEESRCTKHPYYYAGLYYIQEPSAMSSAALLGTRPGERVLDLCAAPGGKTTQIGADLKGEGILYANDLSSSRAKALLKNIELMGIRNAYVCCEDSTALRREFPLYFDRILVDAPCSGEGMFRKHPAVIKAWVEHGKDFYCPVQKILLSDAAEMLKPGGTLLYSTCTYNPNEDENQIIAFLEGHPDFVLDPVPMREGFVSSSLLPGTVRLFPHKAEAEGHFVARLKKTGTPSAGSGTDRNERKDAVSLLGDMEDFFEKVSWKPDPANILQQGEYISLLPSAGGLRRGLRYLRTGLLLGQLKNRRFRPSQALAMALKKEDWADPADFSSGDPDVIRYLKGETVSSPDEKGKGWRLFCTDGFPLGFVKQDGDRLKNMYLPGWRMM